MKKSYMVVGGLSLCLVGYIGYWYLFASDINAWNTNLPSNPVEVVEKDFKLSISTQGTTKITNEQKLRFNTAWRVVVVNFKVGDEVLLWQTIVEIDDKEAQNEIEKASLRLSNAKIKLNDFIADVEDSWIKKSLLNINTINSDIKKKQIDIEYMKNNNKKNKQQLDLNFLQQVNQYKILEQENKKNISNLELSDSDKEKIINEKKWAITQAESEYKKSQSNLDIQILQKQNQYTSKIQQQYLSLQSIVGDTNAKIQTIESILWIWKQRDNFEYSQFFSAKNTQYKSHAKGVLLSLKNDLKQLEQKIKNISHAKDAVWIIAALEIQKQMLDNVYQTANYLTLGFESSITTSGFSQGSIDGYAGTYSSMRQQAQSEISNIISIIDELKNADSLDKIKQDQIDALAIEKNAFDLLKSDLDKTIQNQDFVVNTVEYNVKDENIILEKAKIALEQKLLETKKQKQTLDEENKKSFIELEQLQIQLSEAEKRRDKLSQLSNNQDYIFLRNEVKQNQVSLENTYKRLENYTIQAPFNGKITKVDMKLWDRLNADTQKFISIVNPDDVQVHTYLNQSDIVKVSADMPVEMSIGAYDGVTFSWSIAEIDSSPTDTNGIAKYKVQVTLNNPDSYTLYSGMNVEVKIIQEILPSKILVPFTAVTTDVESGIHSVTLIGNQTGEEKRIVELGKTDGEYYEVLSGLQVWDTVAEIEYNPEKFEKQWGFDDEF